MKSNTDTDLASKIRQLRIDNIGKCHEQGTDSKVYGR